MSILRRAAQKISAMVVRYSSAGNKEWAEGLAREVDFIQNDWRALLWSMGSLRVLLDRRSAPIRTHDDLQLILEKFQKQMQTYKSLWIVAAMQACLGFIDFLAAQTISQHVGRGIIEVVWIFLAIQFYARARTLKRTLAHNDPDQLIGYYRITLQRRLSSLSSPAWWANMVMLALYFTGMTLSHTKHSAYWFQTIAVFVFLPIAVGTWYGRRDARRRLKELDTLLQTGAA